MPSYLEFFKQCFSKPLVVSAVFFQAAELTWFLYVFDGHVPIRLVTATFATSVGVLLIMPTLLYALQYGAYQWRKRHPSKVLGQGEKP